MRRLHDGFTLIELLVVVGIISILASIATPNYMEAITRSKVAKFKGDAHAIESALLSYAIDRQTMPYAEQYPVTSSCETGGNYNPSSPAQGYLPRSLTTPAAYLGKLPTDSFHNLEDQGPCYPERRTYYYSSDYQNAVLFRQYYVSNLYAELTGILTSTTSRPTNATYLVGSPGPDGDRDHGPNSGGFPQDTLVTSYDATNGTLSNGDVFFFGPSIGFTD